VPEGSAEVDFVGLNFYVDGFEEQPLDLQAEF